jgi:O-antigen ligase
MMAYLLGQQVANTLEYITFTNLLNKLFLIVIAFYLFRLVFNLSEYVDIVKHGRYAVQLNSSGESPFLFIASGGWNAEICLLGILSALIIGSPVYRVFVIFFILHVLLFESRVGMIILVSHLIYSFKLSLKWIIRLSATLILTTLVISQFIDLFSLLGDRFSLDSEYEILKEGHGRLFLWGEALDLVNRNPYGYGIGIGIDEAQSNTWFDIPEPNFHNIYLQILVDIGVLGLFGLISIVLFIIKKFIRHKSKLALALILYLIIGFFQFTGYDIFIWFIFGLFVIYNDVTSYGKEKSF